MICHGIVFFYVYSMQDYIKKASITCVTLAYRSIILLLNVVGQHKPANYKHGKCCKKEHNFLLYLIKV